jgi:hypothetical protein
VPTVAISTRHAVIAFVTAVGLAIVLGYLAARIPRPNDILLTALGVVPILFGAGTLLATFCDRRLWNASGRVWIFGFNILTMLLTPMIGSAIRLYLGR